MRLWSCSSGDFWTFDDKHWSDRKRTWVRRPVGRGEIKTESSVLEELKSRRNDVPWRSWSTAGEWITAARCCSGWNVLRLVGLNVAVCVIVLLTRSVSSRGRPAGAFHSFNINNVLGCLCRGLMVCAWTCFLVASFRGLLFIIFWLDKTRRDFGLQEVVICIFSPFLTSNKQNN